MSQHSTVFGMKALLEEAMLHLLHMFRLNPSWILQLEYLDLLQQMHPEFNHILSQSLLEGI